MQKKECLFLRHHFLKIFLKFGTFHLLIINKKKHFSEGVKHVPGDRNIILLHIFLKSNPNFDRPSLRFSKIRATWSATAEPQIGNY